PRSGEGEAGAIGARPARLSVVGATRLLPRLPSEGLVPRLVIELLIFGVEKHRWAFALPPFGAVEFVEFAHVIRAVALRPVDHAAFLPIIAISFINTTLSKLEHNWNRRPTADAKSGPEKTSAPSRDRSRWLACT